MGDVVLMEEVDSKDYLLDDGGCLLFSQSGAIFVEEVEEGAVGGILQDEVDVQLVMEEAIKVDDVGIVAERLQLDFLSYLFFHLVFLDGEFAYLLNGNYHAGLTMSASTYFYLARYTYPNLPLPMHLPKWKSDSFTSVDDSSDLLILMSNDFLRLSVSIS